MLVDEKITKQIVAAKLIKIERQSGIKEMSKFVIKPSNVFFLINVTHPIINAYKQAVMPKIV